jgi:transcriptional regulator with XRE-family HTH domain
MPDEPSNALDAIGADLQVRVGANLRRFREERDLTQEQLAHAAGLATRHLQKIEAGRVNVTLRTLGRLGSSLGVEASVLLEGSDDGVRR